MRRLLAMCLLVMRSRQTGVLDCTACMRAHAVGCQESTRTSVAHRRLILEIQQHLLNTVIMVRRGKYGYNPKLCTYRHDANLALSRLDDAGTVGADQSAARLLFQASLDLDHVMLWNACHGRESQI